VVRLGFSGTEFKRVMGCRIHGLTGLEKEYGIGHGIRDWTWNTGLDMEYRDGGGFLIR
jgi:hypothetical protein